MAVSVLGCKGVPHLDCSTAFFTHLHFVVVVADVDITELSLTPVLPEVTRHDSDQLLPLGLIAVVNHDKGIPHPVWDEDA